MTSHTEKNAGTVENTVFLDKSLPENVSDILQQSLVMAGLSSISDLPAQYGFFNRIDAPGSESVENPILIDIHNEITDTDHIMISPPIRIGAIVDLLLRLKHGLDKDFPDTLTIDPFVFHVQDMILDHQTANKSVRLTEKERDLLYYLSQQPQIYFSRDTLLQDIWGYHPSVETHTVETHFYRLRQKIENDPAKPQFLLSDDNGYAFMVTVSD